MLGIIILITTFFALPSLASAHVLYVLTSRDIDLHGGSDFTYFLHIFQNPANIAILFVAIDVILISLIYIQRIPIVARVVPYVLTKLESYGEFVPWIIRLSLGIALIGAGTTGVLIAPSVPHFTVFGALQVALGFMYLAGFLLIPAAIATIALYIGGLFIASLYLLGNLEILSLAIGFIMAGSPRPGIDDLIGWSALKRIRIPHIYLATLMRVGVGFSFFYLGLYEKLLNPHLAELVFTKFKLSQIIPVAPPVWILFSGVAEMLIGLFLLAGFRTRLTAMIAFVILSVSLFFFKESAYSHVALFGVLSIVFIEGGGYLSVDHVLAKGDVVYSPVSAVPLLSKDS